MQTSFEAIVITAAIALAGASGSALAAGEAPIAAASTDAAVKWGPCPPIFPGDCAIAVLHGNPANPDADIFLRVGPGYRLAPHTHTSSERMVLVTGTLKVKNQGAREVTLTPGTYAYGPAGLPHRADCVSDQPCTLFIAFDTPVDAVAFAGSVD